MRVSEWPRDQKSDENRIVCVCSMRSHPVLFVVTVVLKDENFISLISTDYLLWVQG